MTDSERLFLLHRLDETRETIEKILPTIDPTLEIYPGWTIKDMLAHMTGWDDATIAALKAFLASGAPPVPTVSSGIPLTIARA